MNKSAEDYIKTIYTLIQRDKHVRSVDVAREMGFSKPSVSIAMANLRKNEIIEMQPDGEIRFTRKGKTLAKQIYERHIILSDFLCEIAGVDKETARCDACKMEHDLSEVTYNGIKKYLQSHMGVS